MSKWRQGLAVALGFLTVLPAPLVEYQPGALGRAGRWFPLIGLLIGLLLSISHWVLGQLFSPLLAAGLTVALWAALTGGLHLDGLADCCDGLLAATSRERRLEIMRDPRTGAFAVVGLTLFLMLKVTALAALPLAAPALLLAPTWARWLLLWVARQPLARPSGLGADFAAGLTRRSLLWALALPLALLLGFAIIGVNASHNGDGHLLWYPLAALLFSSGVTWMMIRTAVARLGGVTGDIYGAVVELGELAVLLVFAAGR